MDDYQHHDGADAATIDEGVDRRPTPSYHVRYGDSGLTFRDLQLRDPVPLGRQILEAGGVRDVSHWALLALLSGGGLAEVGADEQTDLRRPGTERFVAFRTDRLFRATLLDRPLLWGRQTITAEELEALAQLGPDEALYLDVPGGTDRRIVPGVPLDLAAAGVERIVAGPRPVPGFEVVVIYNGLVRPVRVQGGDTASATIQAVRPLFGNPGGDLVLVNEAGQQLAPGAALAAQGVAPGSRLQLRPPVVQGG